MLQHWAEASSSKGSRPPAESPEQPLDLWSELWYPRVLLSDSQSSWNCEALERQVITVLHLGTDSAHLVEQQRVACRHVLGHVRCAHM